MARYLIDTNVMMAASAVSELSRVAPHAMPLEPELRELVFDWLQNFELVDDRIVLDEEGLIRDEYEDNLPHNWREQEYAMQVLQHKIDHYLADYVPIDVRVDEHGARHLLSEAFEHLVTDRADHKWVCCALAAHLLHEEMPPIVYGAETDWFIAEAGLIPEGIKFVRLLPDNWYEERIA